MFPPLLLELTDGSGLISWFPFAKEWLAGGIESQRGAECGCSINEIQMLVLDVMQCKIQSFLVAVLLQPVL